MIQYPPLTDYEQERAAKIAENRRKMAQLGLLEASAKWTSSCGRTRHSAGWVGTEQQGPRLKKAKTVSTRSPTRRSNRLASGRVNAPIGNEDYRAPIPVADKKSNEDNDIGSTLIGFTRKGTPRRSVVLPASSTTIIAPFSLRSIGTTVWELGTLYGGPWSKRYWSSAGCLYHHAYPIGYRATKIQFGKTYEMRIQRGTKGPKFEVIDTVTGDIFVGDSPTNPWTEVCLSLKTGQRISGPLFFGFSDPTTQAAIASTLYDEATLKAAITGNIPEAPSEHLSSEELAAKEFMEIDGIGESVAMALALTCQLGGHRHNCLQSLRSWTLRLTENANCLRDFLLTSEDIPSSIRRWPAWKDRVVNRILNDVLEERK
jgi:hypothetical protein